MSYKFPKQILQQTTLAKRGRSKQQKIGDDIYSDGQQPHSRQEQVLQMQRMIGNRATIQVLQRMSSPDAGNEHLPFALLNKMEQSFGTDFSNVGIHTNDSSTDAHDAAAYAQGEAIHFAPGEYQPQTPEGQEIIGHELAHVVQQRQGTAHGAQTMALNPSLHLDPLEAEAHDSGRKAAQGRIVRVKGKSNGIQLWPKWMKRAGRWIAKQLGGGGGHGGGGGVPIGGPIPLAQPQQQGPQTMNSDGEAPDLPMTDDYSREELETHMEAYRTARYYHSTKVENAEKILVNGFDPSKRGKGGADEAQQFNTGSDPRTFFGGDHTTAMYYQRQLGNVPVETLRTFMTPEEIEAMRGDMGDEDNLAYWTPDTIGTEGIIRGNLVDQSHTKLQEIFTIVRMHYPEREQNIPVDEVIARHMECITKGLTTHEHGGKSGKGKGIRGGERRYQVNDNRRMSF